MLFIRYSMKKKEKYIYYIGLTISVFTFGLFLLYPLEMGESMDYIIAGILLVYGYKASKNPKWSLSSSIILFAIPVIMLLFYYFQASKL